MVSRPLNRLLLHAGIAFAVGALVGAALVIPGAGPLASVAPDKVIFVHVENSGSADVNARIVVLDASGDEVVSTSFKAPAHSSSEKSVVNLKPGTYSVRATFTKATARADGRVSISTERCGEGAVPVATFNVDGSSGLTLQGPGTAGCRA